MITLQNIRFGYAKHRVIFEDASITMEPGHIFGLLGRNGAGKTTLLKIMAGLLFPQSGSATIFQERAALRKAHVLRNLYFLQEEMYVPHLTVRHFEAAYAPYYPNFDREQFIRLLREFEIDQLHDYMDKFSFGQKKKALIAFALAANTQVLFMDEPTNGLDIPSKSIFRKILASVADDTRLFVISTHQVRDLHSLIDAVTILDNGRIVLNATTEEISGKLVFEPETPNMNPSEILYREDTPNGIMAVRENSDHRDSNLDLELLFNAVMANDNRLVSVFNNN